MASETAYQNIKSAIGAAAGATPVLDWDQVDPPQHEGDIAWIGLEEDPGSEELESYGDPGAIVNREEGEITVHVFAPAEQGMSAARTLADQIRKNVRQRGLTAETRIRQTDPPSIGGLNNARWSSMEFALAYEHTTFEDIQ